MANPYAILKPVAVEHKYMLLRLIGLQAVGSGLFPLTTFVLAMAVGEILDHGSAGISRALALAALSFGILVLVRGITLYAWHYGQKVSLAAFTSLSDGIIMRLSTGREADKIKTAFANAKRSLDRLIWIWLDFIVGLLTQFTVAGFLIYFYVGANYFWFLLIYGIGVSLFGFHFSKVAHDKADLASSSSFALSKWAQELGENASLIFLNRTENYEQNLLKSKIAEFAKFEFAASKSLSLHNFRTLMFNTAATFLLVLYILNEAGHGRAAIDDLFLLYAYAAMFLAPLNQFPTYLIEARRQLHLLEPLLWRNFYAVDAKNRIDIPDDIIAFEISDFSCDGAGLKLPQRSIRLELGKIYHLKGENGTGKTTILNAIAAQGDFASCTLCAETSLGKSMAIGINERSLVVSYALQQDLIWSRSYEDNVQYAKLGDQKYSVHTDFSPILDACDPSIVGLAGDDPAIDLSGGQRQFVHVLRAICSDRPLLILDEPTNALDSGKIKILKDLLLAISRHRAIVITTHSNLIEEIVTDVIEF